MLRSQAATLIAMYAADDHWPDSTEEVSIRRLLSLRWGWTPHLMIRKAQMRTEWLNTPLCETTHAFENHKARARCPRDTAEMVTYAPHFPLWTLVLDCVPTVRAESIRTCSRPINHGHKPVPSLIEQKSETQSSAKA